MFHVQQWRDSRPFGSLGYPPYADQNTAIRVAKKHRTQYGFEGAEEIVVVTDNGEPVHRQFNRNYRPA